MKLLERLRRLAKHLHDEEESGVAMTEFAIAFPLQFFLTLAIMQFSLLLIGHILVEQAAFSAARAALVADVPPDNTNVATTNDQKGWQQAAAMRAACFMLQPICPPPSEVPGAATSTPAPDAIRFNTDDRSASAWALTKVSLTLDEPTYVGAYVEHDFVLIIPVVNHWFARLQGGTPGEFWYGPNSAKTRANYNQASQTQNITCYHLTHSAFVPRTWRSQ